MFHIWRNATRGVKRNKLQRLLCLKIQEWDAEPEVQPEVKRGGGRQVCQDVLEHFDQQYQHQLGQHWEKARQVLLHPSCWQYGLMLNRFSDSERLTQQLLAQGFSSLLPPTGGSLRCFSHHTHTRFPSQRHRVGRLKQYYLLNAASLLPVLALGVRAGESVLDLCAAPGGKSVAVLQSVTPGFLHCNELDSHRHKWLSETLESFIPAALNGIIRVSNVDGRLLGQREAGVYDKVLVDAPCSNDRSWLFSAHPQQASLRLGERVRLPELQKQLLRSALEAVRPGGMVVYSTCTLSHAENGAVVEEVLSTSPNVELQPLDDLVSLLTQHFNFHPHTPFGLLVVPELGKTWGPMFVSKLKKK